jgi:hypothetical protein
MYDMIKRVKQILAYTRQSVKLFDNDTVTYRPIARQRVAKHIPAEANAWNNRASIVRQRQQYPGNNRITIVSMQRAINMTIKEETFSMWFAYILCWATDKFSICL